MPLPSTAAPWSTGASNGSPTSKASTAISTGYVADKHGEVTSLRSRYSRTYRVGDKMRTKFSSVPVNYRNAAGTWVPIDTSLAELPGGGAKAQTDAVQVTLPSLATKPAITSEARITIASTLLGSAAVKPTISGSAATYLDVFPNADMLFDVQDDAVEQTFRLANEHAPASYSSSLAVPEGSTLHGDKGGSLSVLSHAGTVQATLPAPVMRDSSTNPDTNTSTAVSYSVSGSSPRYTVTTTVNRAWLHSPRRVFPVLLDPGVNYGYSDDLGCYIATGTGTPPDPKLCSGNTGTANTLAYGHTAYLRRIYLQFGDLTESPANVFPPDAVVTNAALTLTESTASSPSTPIDTEVLPVTSAWTSSSLSWASQPSASTNPTDHLSVTPPGVGNSVVFDTTSAVQQIINGTSANHGLLIRQVNESAGSNTIQFTGLAGGTGTRPFITVSWSPQIGQQSFVGAYDHQLSDRTDLHLDLATMNLVINTTDEALTGPGQSLIVRHTYNSESGSSGAYGAGWSMSGGVDSGISIGHGAIAVTRPGGAVGVFDRNFVQPSLTVKQSDNNVNGPSWLSAAGWKADLTQPDATHYKLTFRATHVVWNYALSTASSTSAPLTSVADGSGNTITYTSAGGVTTVATDTTGQRSVHMGYTSGLLTSMTESLASGATGARSWSYSYLTGGPFNDITKLSTSTDPAGKTTRYCYDNNMNLTKIVTARGTALGETCATTQGTDVTDITWGTGGVLSISYENGTASPITVQFQKTQALAVASASSQGITQETDPYGKATTYRYDIYDRIVEVVSPMGTTETSTFNTNNDVTASVTPNNYTGGGSDPTTNSTYVGDNLTKATTPTGATISAGYTGTESDQPSSVSDDRDQSAGNLTSASSTGYTYNPSGQLTSTIKGAATVTIRHQGESGVASCGPSATAAYPGAVCETRDADYSASTSTTEHRTLYSYDSLGELVSTTPPQPDNSRTTPPAVTATYDGQSRLHTVTDSRGKTTTYSYDMLDRMTRRTNNDGTYTAYTWDEDGNPLSVIDYSSAGVKASGHSDVYTYDSLNRRSTETQDGQPAIIETWDANSRLLTFDDGSGSGAATYGYNDDGQLTSYVEPGGSCAGFTLAPPTPVLPTSTSKCILLATDKNGARLRTVYPGGGEQDQTFDTGGSISTDVGKGISSGTAVTLFNYSYSYDIGTTHTAHLADRADLTAGTRLDYGYGNEGRLGNVTQYNSATLGTGSATAAWLYCYDANGNRLSTSTTIGATCPGGTTYTYDGANQQSGGGTGYDLSGDETSAATAIPAAGTSRVSSWTDSQALSTVTINGSSLLISSYFGPGNNNLIGADTGGSTSDSVRNSPLGVSQVTHFSGGTETGRVYIERDPSGAILALRDNASGARYYPLVDERGSILRLLSNTGLVVDSFGYDASGTKSVVSNGYNQPFGYAGAYTNPGSGLTHLGARWLDPTLGRFTQPDPQSHPGDVSQSSPYPYAGDDPVNNTDLSGQSIFGDIVAASVAVVGLAAIPLELPVVATGAAVVGTAIALDYVACDFGSGIDCDFY